MPAKPYDVNSSSREIRDGDGDDDGISINSPSPVTTPSPEQQQEQQRRRVMSGGIRRPRHYNVLVSW
ncbi:hypothetical protein C7212DRAFT_333350 [Tuber magnatum]|uniref:Uncharacterized protein n=1 Tax=Tuber magnatum TaxID=42249 RepID=A0A317SEP0_9PEZI|nr:hypothetical protein C7212DRAFT_333350 [Tuber magnatum]